LETLPEDSEVPTSIQFVFGLWQVKEKVAIWAREQRLKQDLELKKNEYDLE
jgi:hypothetical protein